MQGNVSLIFEQRCPKPAHFFFFFFFFKILSSELPKSSIKLLLLDSIAFQVIKIRFKDRRIKSWKKILWMKRKENIKDISMY